nr:ankyrin repeat domain-containing protein SOWAHC [Anolis sagrei ordinatus]
MEPAAAAEEEDDSAVGLKSAGDPGMELSQEAVLGFLAERGGRARNAELLEHFRGCLNSPEPARRAQARQRFKEMVNAVAVVKQEPRDGGAKYVQLRKKHWRRSGGSGASSSTSSSIAQGASEPAGGGGERSNRRSAEEEEEEEDAPAGGRAGLEPEGGKPEEEEPGAPSRLSSSSSSSSSSGLALKKSRRLGSSPQMKRGGSGVFPRAGEWEEEEESGLSVSGPSSVALDPVEHAWMLLCASWEGRWESLEAVLSGEPALLGRRDFVTGFSCLHWAAKHGRAELLARLVGFARRRGLAVDVNARTAGGYTALHLAAMHGRLEVVKLLVGAYDADVELRDYSGRKAAHYLSAGAAGLRSLMGSLHDGGGGEEGEAGSGAGSRSGAGGGGRWRLSKVLPTHLLAHRPTHHEDSELTVASLPAAAEGALPAGKLSRKSSSGRAKARLHKVRFRTQIVHTTPSFRVEAEAEDNEEEGGGAPEERPLKGSFKLRPKSNVFG